MSDFPLGSVEVVFDESHVFTDDQLAELLTAVKPDRVNWWNA